MDIWAFIKDTGRGGWSLLTVWRRWGQEDRAEIEKTYQGEIEVLQEQLNDAGSDEEKARIRADIQRVRDELRSFHRARRELLLSKSLVERMTPSGAITAEEPPLPQADRELLEAAASIIARLDPPNLPDEFVRQGNAFYRARDFQKALEQYDRALELRPDDHTALQNRGVTLSNLGHLDEALAELNRALELRPDHVHALNNRGVTLGKLGRNEEGLTDFNRSLELDPDQADTLYNRGLSLSYINRFDEALGDYSRSIELVPNNPDTLYNRGIVLGRDLKRYQEALADFNRAAELAPDDPGILNNRGLTLRHLERVDDALDDFSHAIKSAPDSHDAMYNLASLQSVMGQHSEALKQLREAVSRDSTYRATAREDDDFANLRSDPALGPAFERLVAEPED